MKSSAAIQEGALLPDARGENRWRVAQRFCEGRSFDLWFVDDQHVEGVRAVAKVIRYVSSEPAHVAARRALLEAERDLYLLPSALLPEPLDWVIGENGEPVLVYELQSGDSLEALVAQSGPLGLARTTRIVRELAHFASELHAAGFVLRDLGPAHIIVGLDDTVQVVGLGNAVRAGMPGAEDTHKTSYTAGFGAPELAERGIVAPSVDAYALGSLLAFLSTGAADGAPPSPLDQLLRAAHAQSPSTRPTARALHDELVAVAKGLATQRIAGASYAQPASTAARTSSAVPTRASPAQPALQNARQDSAAPVRASAASQPNQSGAKTTSATPTRAPTPSQREAPRAPSQQATPAQADAKARDQKDTKQAKATWPWWVLVGVLTAGAGAAVVWLRSTGKL